MKHLHKYETYGFEKELGMEIKEPTCDSCGCEDCECDPTEKHEGDVCPSCGCKDCECVETKSYESRHLFNFQLFVEQKVYKSKDGKFDPELTKRISAMSKKQVDQRAAFGYDSNDPNNLNLDYGLSMPTSSGEWVGTKKEYFDIGKPWNHHDYLQWYALASSFFGPWGLAISTVLSLIDSYVYYKEGDNKMAILMLIFACIPALKWGKMLNLGKATLGSKGLIEFAKKFSFRGGKLVLNKGVQLTLDEKRYLLALTKNISTIVVEIESKSKILLKSNPSLLKSVLVSVSQVVGMLLGFVVYDLGYDYLIDPQMSGTEKQEVTKTLAEATEKLKKQQ